MTPILYKASEKDFLTNGLGRLSDAISCIVTEERNGSYELEMVYPVDGIHYKDISNSRIIYAKPADSKKPQPFRIYNISRPMTGKVTVRAEHISYQMSDIPVMPFTADGVTTALMGLNKNAAEPSPFTFWTDKQTAAKFSFDTPQSMRSLLGGESGSILDAYGGEWEWDRFTARLWNERGRDNGVTIRYGKNLTDIKQEESIAETYTGILPYWKGTVESDTASDESEDPSVKEDSGSSEETVYLDEKIVYSTNADKFPFHKTKVIDFSQAFEEKPTQEQLRNAAQAYIKSNGIGVPKVSITLSFVPLWQTEEYKDKISIERVNLCDTVHVEFADLGVSATAKVNKTEFDVLSERYESIELGDARATLTDSFSASLDDFKDEISGEYSTKTLLQQSVDRASKMITGGLGGHVVLKMNADNQPEEILILADDTDYTKAQQVWRWNKNGLGYSSTGYDGEYRTAITADGHMVADFMDTGSLIANVIKSGLLTDTTGKNFWNLDTGEFQLSSTTKVGDKTIGDVASSDNLTQMDVYNKLTNNGAAKGIYLYNGNLYINGDYINTGQLDASLIRLYGFMPVYESKSSSIYGGYIGYKEGSTGTATTYGIGIARGNNAYSESRIMVTNAGAILYNASTTNGDSNFLAVSGNCNITARNSRAYSNLYVYGEFSVEGAKNRCYKTEDFGKRLLGAYETPMPMFGDYGESLIADDGKCYIDIDPIYAQTTRRKKYHVFLTKYGKGDIWVSERDPAYFVVEGTPGLEFSWNIVAIQADQNARMQEFTKLDIEDNMQQSDYVTDAREKTDAMAQEDEKAELSNIANIQDYSENADMGSLLNMIDADGGAA